MNPLLLCCVLVVPQALPESLPHDTAATSLAAVDRDFEFQGEYLGQYSEPIGLQVVALGDGQFAARRYQGGLPGAGADCGRVLQLDGQRQNDVVQLRGASGERVTLHGGIARYSTGQSTQPILLRKIVRQGPTLGLKPPAGARVLFGAGHQPTRLQQPQLAEDGTLLAGATTAEAVRDFHLHLEFRTPYMPHAREQARGNSGVYIQRRYEVQILDSFGLSGAYNECGALYKQRAPQLNMCLPPLSWQTYDIHFTAARWDTEGRKRRDALITVYHNGVAIHYQQPIPEKTGAGQPEGPQPLPIHFQDHGNPVTFRNVWIVDQHTGECGGSEQPGGDGALRRRGWARRCR